MLINGITPRENTVNKPKKEPDIERELEETYRKLATLSTDELKSEASKLLKKKERLLKRELKKIKENQKLLMENPEPGVIVNPSCVDYANNPLLDEEEYKNHLTGKANTSMTQIMVKSAYSITAWQKFENVMQRCASRKQIEKIVKKYLDIVESGEAWAMRDFLDRWFGKPTERIIASIETTNMTPEQKVAEINLILGLDNEKPKPIEVIDVAPITSPDELPALPKPKIIDSEKVTNDESESS